MKKNNKKIIFEKNLCECDTKKGFSLVESLVAVFIFTLAMTMLAGTFSSFLKSFVKAKKAQKSTESAQYAINLMAKTIRSSTVDPLFSQGSSILMFDNSSAKCIIYKYEAGVLKMASAGDNKVTIVDISNCASAPALATFNDLTKSGEISNVNFKGIPSVNGGNLGKITISETLFNEDAVQVTISLRQ